jgi:hypothetical protein
MTQDKTRQGKDKDKTMSKRKDKAKTRHYKTRHDNNTTRDKTRHDSNTTATRQQHDSNTAATRQQHDSNTAATRHNHTQHAIHDTQHDGTRKRKKRPVSSHLRHVHVLLLSEPIQYETRRDEEDIGGLDSY